MEPLRVLQVLHILNRGGAEAMIMNLYRKVDRSRVQFDFLVHEQEKGLFEDEITQMGGRIFRVQAFKGYNLLSYYNECKRLFKAHPEIKVVHGHLGSCAAYYLKAAKECGVFTIAHSHNASSSALYKFFSYPTRFVADSLFGCSTEAGIDRFGNKYVNSNKYQNFNNAVDPTQFKYSESARIEFRQEFDISEETVLVGTVGRINTQKNPFRTFNLFKYLVEHNKNVKCLWVGTGDLEEEIKNKICETNLQESIILTGIRSDIPRVMSAIDCMLFPSLWEGLPVSVIESQAANLPTVLADTISKETEISPLLSWHSLDEDDEVWCNDIMKLAESHKQHRSEYSFNMSTTGYDINETVKWLMNFYEIKSIL